VGERIPEVERSRGQGKKRIRSEGEGERTGKSGTGRSMYGIPHGGREGDLEESIFFED